MNALTIPPRTRQERIDWNSLFLLLLLIVPAAAMWVMLLLLPGVTWSSPIIYATIEVLGSFTVLLLAVFFIARYKDRPGTLYISAGLTGMAIMEGFLTVTTPQSVEYAWLHSIAGIFGGLLFLFGVMSGFSKPLMPRVNSATKGAAWLLGGCAVSAFFTGISTILFSKFLPLLTIDSRFTVTAWVMVSVPVILFLFTSVASFASYRRTGAQDAFILSAIVIFLFQASEVYYFAELWSPVWWFWQGMRLVVYVSILTRVLKEYIQTSDSLSDEVEERKRVETALRKAEQDWRNSFNSIDDIMLIVNRDFTIERINESGLAFLKKAPDEAAGQKCFRLFHITDKPCEGCPCRRSFRNGKVALAEHYEEEHGRTVALKSAPILNGSGKPEKCVCLMRDITREVRAREKEKQLQQELNMAGRLASIGEVAAGIAHEINNPLTGVIGFAQLLANQEIPEEMREAVEVIEQGAMRTAGVVQKLLTFARRSKSKREYADINAAIRSTVDIRAYEMRTNNIELVLDLAADLPRTMANFGHLQQVFLNLIVNAEQAIGAAGHPGRLVIKSEQHNGCIKVTVADNGVGIQKEHLGKLFDPFFTTKADNGGTGLGLSISYGIIKEHSGNIRVRSALSHGATFIVTIPIVAETFAAEQPAPVMPVARPKNARIIVVDDEVNICRVLHRVLTQEGHEVDTVLSAEAALEKMKYRVYDLILLDIKMPGMSGIELYRHMTVADPAFKDKVVFLTGDVVSPGNRSFLEENGVNYVTKPFTGDILVRQVNYALGGQRKNE